jgi:type VI secretion system secreted protein VgrG
MDNARHTVRYFVEIGGVLLLARELRGHEELNRPYRFEAWLPLEKNLGLDPSSAVRSLASVVMADDEREIRRIEGIVTDIAIEATITGASSLRVVIEPRLAALRFRSDIRVFRNKSAVDIVLEVLRAHGLVVHTRLSASYEVRPYCVQMRETDLAFASRLLEDEGIAYFLLGSGGDVVLCDNVSAWEPLPDGATLAYRAASSMEDAAEHVTNVGHRAEMTVGRVTLRDFNPEHPSLDMDVGAPVPGSNGPEHYDYPGEYEMPPSGAQKAQRRAEAWAANAAGIEGTSTCGRLLPGHQLSLVDTPGGSADGSWVVTSVDHRFQRDEAGLQNRFAAFPAERPWRPAMVTPEPQLSNPMTAYVTGPDGEDIFTDDIGRVKVHFLWDRLQPWDETCSHWVPVLQDNTGHSVAIPRIGWEVLVHFLEGDPDRPVVLGRLYNGADPFPEALPEGKTRSALQSLSSPSRDGHNTIRFDDAAGKEHAFIHAERDQNVVVANDKREDVVADETDAVGNDETMTVGNNDTRMVGGNRTVAVEGDQTLTVGAKRTRKVQADNNASVTGNHDLTIGAGHVRRIGTDDNVMAKNLREQIAAVALEASVGPNSLVIGKAGTFTVGGAIVELTAKAKSESTQIARAETIGGVLFSKSGKATSVDSKARVTTVGGALKVTATEEMTLKGGLKLTALASLGTFTHVGGISLKVGETCSVVMKGSTIAMTAPGDITFQIGGDATEGSSKSTQK